jgi:hypothetical protein
MGAAVIGVLAVSLVRLAPYALPDVFAVVILVATVTVLLLSRVSAIQLMLAGSVLGVLRARLLGAKVARAVTGV